MMKRTAVLISLFLCAALPLASAKDSKPAAPRVARPAATADGVVRQHVRSFLEGNFDKMAESYAAEIRLMAGHEMLKADRGLVDEGARATGASVKRAAMIGALKREFGGRDVVPEDKVETILTAFAFTRLEAAAGDFSTDPADPVDTPDGKLHFDVEPGDAVFKVGPEKGDFLLFQLRQTGGRWQIVAEYLD
jgi:hypothetical protein